MPLMALWNSTAVLLAIVYGPDGFRKLLSAPRYRRWRCPALWNSASIHLTIVSVVVLLAVRKSTALRASVSAAVMAIRNSTILESWLQYLQQLAIRNSSARVLWVLSMFSILDLAIWNSIARLLAAVCAAIRVQKDVSKTIGYALNAAVGNEKRCYKTPPWLLSLHSAAVRNTKPLRSLLEMFM
jgi:hypothetical protein